MNRPLEINQVVAHLSGLGFWVCQIREAAPTGIPQVFAVRDGKLFAFTVKRPGFGPSRPERRRFEELEAAGAVVAVVSSVDEVLEALTRQV